MKKTVKIEDLSKRTKIPIIGVAGRKNIEIRWKKMIKETIQ